jgi:hypothetical protein
LWRLIGDLATANSSEKERLSRRERRPAGGGSVQVNKTKSDVRRIDQPREGEKQIEQMVTANRTFEGSMAVV